MRSRRTPIVVGVLVVAAAAAILLAGGLSSAKKQSGPIVLPSHVLVPPRATVAGLKGKPAILHYWASWCTPCRQEAPELAKLETRLGGRAALVGINWSDERAAARAFVQRYHWTFPNLTDADARTSDSVGLQGLPTTLILNAKGEIAKRLYGPQTADGLAALVR